jgi:pectin methylesterase-like acyl-CoA thioesterase
MTLRRGGPTARRAPKCDGAQFALLLWVLALVGSCGGDPPRPAFRTASTAPVPTADPTAAKPPEPVRTLLAAVRPSFPEPSATGVCTDVVLALALEPTVALGSSGTIRVVDIEADVPVDQIELGAPSYPDVIGGRTFLRTSPVVVEAGVARVRLHTAVLRPSRTYAVTIGEGVFVDSGGRSLGALLDPSAWRFTTRASRPASPSEIVVAADGSGDFCSVQGAFDFVPAGNARPIVITVKRGTYREIVFVENKGNVTLRGEDRGGTLVADTNNEVLQNKQGSKVRALVAFENVNDLVIENLTLHNTTPQGGSQAEALRVDPGERVIVRNANFLSRQDTLLLTGRVYVSDSYVEGNVDYVWGKGTAYFERVELKTIGRPGWNVQARNPADRFGYVFVDSTLSADADVSGHLLARIDAVRFPASHVAYVGCKMGPAVDAKGWEITPVGTTATSGIRFWEYGTRSLDDEPVDLSKRQPAARKLSKSEAAKMRDKKFVLGGWDPEAK